MLKKLVGILLIVTVLTGCANKGEIQKDNSDVEVSSKLKVVIDEKEYIINLENNETAKGFARMLPLELNMSELNRNEKYVYSDKSLATNSLKPKRINAGDIMLYGDNCLVIFYKSFNTPYSYTKIGHIDNLRDLGKENIVAKFEIK